MTLKALNKEDKVGYTTAVGDTYNMSEIRCFSYKCIEWSRNRVRPIVSDSFICYSENDLRTLIAEKSVHSEGHLHQLELYLRTVKWR